SRMPWIFFDLLFVFATFCGGVMVSPYGKTVAWNQPFMITASLFSVIFVLFSIGLGYYDRARRYRYSDIFRIGTLGALFALVMTLTVIYFVYYGVFGRLTLVWGTSVALACNLA